MDPNDDHADDRDEHRDDAEPDGTPGFGRADDLFAALPDEVAALLGQVSGGDPAGLLSQLQTLFSTPTTGPVNWELAERVALQLAAEDDRSPTDEERGRAEQAHALAELWLDESSLPSSTDAGRFEVTSRQGWVNAAIRGIRPLVEPIAAATTRSMTEVARTQLDEMGLDELIPGLPVGDLSGMLAPMGATLTAMQAGQVIGQLARTLIGQYDLGVPTADPAVAYHVAPNGEGLYDGYDLDPVEVALVVALHESAARRQYHAVPWLASHQRALIAEFAGHARVDTDAVLRMSQELAFDLDPDDPESLRAALERAQDVHVSTTPEQGRVLARLQGTVSLLQAWARSEVARVAGTRLPNHRRIEEVLRRHRGARGDGERLLAQLLGLDLRVEDETVGDRFVAAVEGARGPEGLRRALAHPENLPDADELADPSRWLVRMAGGETVPDDPSALFGLGDAPVEPSARDRARSLGDPHADEGDHPDAGPDANGADGPQAD